MRCLAGFRNPGRLVPLLGLVLMLVLALGQGMQAGPSAQAGPYHVEAATDPEVSPVGRASVLVKVTDTAGNPVEKATVRVFVAMPGMKMGEREEAAEPLAGQPGVYRAPATFGMAGAYQATVTVKALAGEGKALISLSTGTSVGLSKAGFPWLNVAGLLILVGVAVFVLVMMRRTGQRVDPRAMFNRTFVGAVLLIALVVAASVVAVRTLRRPGSMTPIEGQAMEMSLPAPVGAVPVELAAVRVGDLDDVVRYSGQAVGFVEQDAIARVQGTILEMPVYVGTRVRQGHLMAMVPLFTGGRLQALLRGARESEKAALSRTAWELVDVVRDTRAAYAKVLLTREGVEIASWEVAQRAENVRLAQSRYDAGRITMSVVLRARAELAAARQRENDARHTRAILISGAIPLHCRWATCVRYSESRRVAQRASQAVVRTGSRLNLGFAAVSWRVRGSVCQTSGSMSSMVPAVTPNCSWAPTRRTASAGVMRPSMSCR